MLKYRIKMCVDVANNRTVLLFRMPVSFSTLASSLLLIGSTFRGFHAANDTPARAREKLKQSQAKQEKTRHRTSLPLLSILDARRILQW